MSEKVHSKALEVNLSQTKQEEAVLSVEHEYFLSLSSSYYGVNVSIKEFFAEYYHKYANYQDISNRLRKIAIGDYWLYSDHENAEKNLGIIIDLINELLVKNLAFDILNDLVRTLIDFTGLMLTKGNIYTALLKKSIGKLHELLLSKQEVILLNSDTIKNQLSPISGIENMDVLYYSFFRDLCSLNLSFWDKTTCIDEWLSNKKYILSEDSVSQLKDGGKILYEKYYKILDQSANVDALEKNIPLYFDLSNYYRKLVTKLQTSQDQFQYIVYLLNISSMNHQKDYLMYDLNIILKNIFNELNEKQIIPFLDNIFSLFSELKITNTSSVLTYIKTLGVKLATNENLTLCQYFEKKSIELGFVGPSPGYHTDEWRMNVNPYHIVNIRVWLEVFELAPEKYQMILAGLTANLKLGGVFIFDTDLFQKDITKLLNTNIKGSFKLVKQLCRTFPVYFNEIGAEGELRDVTTQLDEISYRQDKLIHFLRKQIHTESNNTHIELTKSIFNFWSTQDLNQIKLLLPTDVFDDIQVEGAFVHPINKLIQQVSRIAQMPAEELIYQEITQIERWIDMVEDSAESERKRMKLICHLYFLLVEKYSFNTVNICNYLRKYCVPPPDIVNQLEEYLNSNKTELALKTVYEIMELLNDVIFNESKTEGWENIYYKRHIAYGIPSMYGSYHEEKFEALGKIFKLEQFAIRLMEDLKKDLNLNYITVDTLIKISRILELYQQGLKIDGIFIKGLDLNLKMFRFSLKSQSFSLNQYINLFRFMGESIREIITKYFFQPYDEPLKIIIPQIFGCENLNAKELTKFIHQKSEEFYREMLSSAFLLQSLDAFISEIIVAMRNMIDNYNPDMIRDIMSFNPDMIISPLYTKTPTLDNQVFLGLKAYFQKQLYLLGYPVPPGFIITTEVFRRKETILNHPLLSEDIDRAIQIHIRKLEKLTGKQLGNPNNPLLLSVRSGSAISMPGAMDTFLNVGVNEQIIKALSKQENFGWTSWDCYRRFLQCWGMSYGIERDVYDKIMMDYKIRYTIKQKADFTSTQMCEIAYSYKDVLTQNNIHINEDPFQQLKQAILSVFNSWNSDRAITYRKILKIADEWGTAVIVQKMVLGNLNYTSGTGVLFTHAPYIKKHGIHLFGDYSSVSQGEDIVGGLVSPLAVSSNQPFDHCHEKSLENAFPEIYKRLHDIAVELIEKHGFSHQEIEFTFESQNPEDLYILQTRDQDISSKSKITVFADSINDEDLIGNGVGIGNGVLNGIIIFGDDDLKELKNNQSDQKLILVRPDTVPDDIGLIYECDGLITAKGGVTSHAAVTAARLGKVCIVNTVGLVVDEKNKVCFFNGEKYNAGTKVAIDGINGCIYKGHFPVTFLT